MAAKDPMNADATALFWPNKLGRSFLLSLEDVMGRQALNAVLNLAKLRHLINNYPPDNLDLGWSFQEMADLNQALEDMHGTLGGRSLAVRAGRAGFYYILKDYGRVLGLGEGAARSSLALRLVPLSRKIRLGLNAMADTFSKTSDQIVRIEQHGDIYYYHVDRCPVCWGRTADEPLCHALLGLLQESIYWVTGGQNLHVEETACIARGDSACTFTISMQRLG